MAISNLQSVGLTLLKTPGMSLKFRVIWELIFKRLMMSRVNLEALLMPKPGEQPKT